jgi:hypothetical protein
MYKLTSQKRELRSAGPAPPTLASSPHLLTKLRQQKIHFLRDASVSAVSGHRIKIRSRLFTDLSGLEIVALIQDILAAHLAVEIAPDGIAPTTSPPCQLEDMIESTQFLQFADAL